MCAVKHHDLDAFATKDTQFGQRMSHDHFVLSAAAGLFVSPADARLRGQDGKTHLRSEAFSTITA
jgi:oxepin-CoA hydrolase/3-oxo-5,6-dehydrosuberyl-CoA semialdehyde dehydrogenase